MSGSVKGRPLVSKTRSKASRSQALAARPYTVSVGMPTGQPSRSQAPASWIEVPIIAIDFPLIPSKTLQV
jgi:hypothetical protein